MAYATAGPAVAGFTIESELNGTSTNNTVGTAQNIQPGFDGTLPATAFNVAGSFSHTSISGRGGSSDVDFYSFATLGGRAYFDIDNDPFAFDTFLSLFDAAGTLIAIGDDSALDPGSVSTLDSFLGVIILAPGTYRIAVTQFGNSPSGILTGTGGLTRPDGSPSGGQTVTATPGNSSFSSNGPQPVNSLAYTMNVSVENASPSVATPAPATILVGLFAAGFAGLARAVRRKVTA